MSFCAQCGRPIDPTLHFCPACGASRTPTAPLAPPAASSYAPPQQPAPYAAGAWGAPQPAGPVGRTREPIVVLLLLFFTLGIYSFFYWWRVSKETDAYAGTPGHAHGKVKLGVILYLCALPVLIIGYGMLLSAILSADLEADPAAGGDGFAAALGGSMLLLLAGVGAGFAGFILWTIGQYRVWTRIETDERQRGVPHPLSPGLQLFFVLMPYVNLVTVWIAYWRTQKGLNGMWAAAAAPGAYAPPPPSPPAAR